MSTNSNLSVLIDTDTHCSVCNGKGTTREKTERGTFLTEDCWRCRGTGQRGLHVLEPSN